MSIELVISPYGTHSTIAVFVRLNILQYIVSAFHSCILFWHRLSIWFAINKDSKVPASVQSPSRISCLSSDRFYIFIVHIGDFEFTSFRGTLFFNKFKYLLVVHIISDDGEIGFGFAGFFYGFQLYFLHPARQSPYRVGSPTSFNKTLAPRSCLLKLFT